jgi:hypothetical protein
MVAALDSAEIDPLTPGIIILFLLHVSLQHLNLPTSLLLLTPILRTATLLCCCCRLLRNQRKIRSLNLWFFQLFAVLHLTGTALQRQDLVREGPSGPCGFLRLAAHAAVVEDTAAWAELADAGVVLSADVAGL